MKLASQWIEMTLVLILAYLILSNADGFNAAVRSFFSGYVSSVKALQGR